MTDAATPTTPTLPDLQNRLALNREEAAVVLGISPRKVWELCNCGELPHRKVGARVLIPVDRLRAWANGEETK